jgi:excisionase family DNA binding protein
MSAVKSESTMALQSPEVLTLIEAAAYLRVPEDALREMAAKRMIPARQIGEEWRFLKAGLQDWLRRGSPPGEQWPFGPPWFENPPWELLIAELERRLLLKFISLEQGRREGNSKQRLLELAGTWKNDPTLDEMLKEIYRGRGRPMAEDKE